MPLRPVVVIATRAADTPRPAITFHCFICFVPFCCYHVEEGPFSLRRLRYRSGGHVPLAATGSPLRSRGSPLLSRATSHGVRSSRDGRRWAPESSASSTSTSL